MATGTTAAAMVDTTNTGPRANAVVSSAFSLFCTRARTSWTKHRHGNNPSLRHRHHRGWSYTNRTTGLGLRDPPNRYRSRPFLQRVSR